MNGLSWDFPVMNFNLIVRWSCLIDKRKVHWYTRVYSLVSRIIHCYNTVMLILVIDTNQSSMTYVILCLLPVNDSSLMHTTSGAYSWRNRDEFKIKVIGPRPQYLLAGKAFATVTMSWRWMCGRLLSEEVLTRFFVTYKSAVRTARIIYVYMHQLTHWGRVTQWTNHRWFR